MKTSLLLVLFAMFVIFHADAVAGVGWIDDGIVVRLETSTDAVGVGTTLPSSKLHVSGGDFIVDNSNPTYSYVKTTNNGASGQQGIFRYNGKSTNVEQFVGQIVFEKATADTNSGIIRLQAGDGIGGAAERMTIGSDGSAELFGSLKATDIITKGPWVDVRAYASINAAITSIGSAKKTLLVPNAQTLTASLTIPSTLALQIINGGSIVKASTYTLTINGPFEAGLYQVFSGFSVGDVTFLSGAVKGAVKEVYPEWWGAVGNGSTDDSAAIARAAACAKACGIPLKFSNATYLVSSTIDLTDTVATQNFPMRILGEGRSTTIKTVTTLTNGIFKFGGVGTDDPNRAYGRIDISNLVISGPAETYGGSWYGKGIYFNGVQGVSFRNIVVQGFDTGIYFNNTDLVDFDGPYWIRHNNAGVQVTASGGAASSGGGSNSYNFRAGYIVDNNNYGVDFAGGLAPNFLGVNFAVNGTSLRVGYSASFAAVCSTPVIKGCYFEADSAYAIFLGGGAGGGICMGGDVGFNNIYGSATSVGVYTGNVDAYPRIHDNYIGGPAGFTKFSAGNGAHYDYVLGNTDATSNELTYTQSRGYISHGQRRDISFTLAASASVDLITVTGPATSWSGIIIIRGEKPGAVTLKTFTGSMMGGAATGGINTTALNTSNYGSGTTFSISETSSGGTTNKVVLTNGTTSLTMRVEVMDFGANGSFGATYYTP